MVGDIHGCRMELLALLDQAGLGADDEIIALGDVVDRGPDSPGVLDILRTWPKARTLRGNHERKHIRSFRGEIAPARSQQITRIQFGEVAYPDAVAFMDTLPIYLDLPEALLVHGFWEPGVPLSQQRETVLVGTMSGQARLNFELSAEPWFTRYDGPKPIIVGHLDYSGQGTPFVYHDRVFGLDTGCCTGGTLTGLLLPEFRFISVPSGADYWRVLRSASPAKPGPAALPSSRVAVWDEAGEGMIVTLLALIQKQHARTIAELQQRPGFATLARRGQDKAYAALVGRSPLARYLFAAQRQPWTLEKLKKDIRTPARVEALLKRVAAG